MRICFTLDDVIRAKTKQICKVYKKYMDQNMVLNTIDLSDINNFWKTLGFETKAKFEKFLYTDYSLEIFAEAPVMYKTLDKELNLWHMKISDIDDNEEENEFIIANPYEFNQSIGYTCSFLAKIATRSREIFFPKNSLDIWNKCDVLVTADPKLLENKPSDKISVKINTDYNKENASDYSFDSIKEIINNDNRLINTICNKND